MSVYPTVPKGAREYATSVCDEDRIGFALLSNEQSLLQERDRSGHIARSETDPSQSEKRICSFKMTCAEESSEDTGGFGEWSLCVGESPEKEECLTQAVVRVCELLAVGIAV